MGVLHEKLLGDKEETKAAPEEDCLDWDPEPAAGDAEAGLDGDEAMDGEAKQSLAVSICSLLCAIPAIIGSWCWPILVGAIFGVAASGVPGGLVAMFHGIQVAIMLALMTNIIQFAYWKQRGKSQKAVYMLVVAAVLVLIQPTSMLVIGSYHDAALAQGGGCIAAPGFDFTDAAAVEACVSEPPFGNFFFDGDDDTNALTPNTVTGWLIQVFGTYGGFLLMFVAVFDVTKLGQKLKKKWAAIRRAAAKN